MSKKRKTVLIILLVLIAAFLIDGIICNTTLTVSYHTYDYGTQESIRIVQLSDLHNASFGKDNSRLLEKVKSLDPDLIVLTGDLIDSTRAKTSVALELSADLVQIAPVYFVSGNHEAWMEGYEKFEKDLMQTGVTVLKNESRQLEINGTTINMAGIEDPYFLMNKNSSIENELSKIPASDGLNILLSHRPEYFDAYAQSGYDIVLTGHAHGGQIRLPLIGGMYAPDQGLFPEYDAGVYESGDMNMAVSRGLGNSVLPLRINNPAEIVVMDIG